MANSVIARVSYGHSIQQLCIAALGAAIFVPCAVAADNERSTVAVAAPPANIQPQSNIEQIALPRTREAGINPAGVLPNAGEAFSHSDTLPGVDQAVPPILQGQVNQRYVAAPPFDMSNVERIRVRVLGYQEFSGEYNIDSDLTVSLPGIGRIQVSGNSPSSFELLLSEKLSPLIRRETTVSVDVLRFRPFSIMGQIVQPGAIEWRPGLNVIQAVALAGGVLRPGSGAERLDATRINGHTLVNEQARTQLKFALAQLARLKAEKEGANSVELTQRITALIQSSPASSQAALRSFIERQNVMLEEQRAVLQTQVEGLERERDMASRELEAAEVQGKAVSEQLEISRSMLQNVETLKRQQLVTNSRYLTQRSELITIEVRYAEAQSLIERARGRVSALNRQVVAVKQERRAILNDRIEALEREAAQLEAGLSGTEAAAASDAGGLKLSYHIARRGTDGTQNTAVATVFTELLPGDVLIISGSQERGQEEGFATVKASVGGASDQTEGTQKILESSATYRAGTGLPRTRTLGDGTAAP